MPASQEAQSQFITMVQTGLIIRYNSADPSDGSLSRSLWAIEHLEDAYKLAPHIPADVSSREAAEAFLTWVFDSSKLTDDDKAILSILLPD